VEHRGIVYAFDVHFEPTKAQADRFVRWEEEGEEVKVFADYCVMLVAPKEKDPEFERLIEDGVFICESADAESSF